MSIILNIDCTTERSFVQIVVDGYVTALETNNSQTDHAAFLHPAIERVLKTTGVKVAALDAVAVTSGPGSYTGIRIGMATAKGLCVATGKPLILFNRLQLMAMAMQEKMTFEKGFYCPMIDARRMEVFCALFSEDLSQIIPPNAHILSTVSFRDEVGENPTVVSGSGAEKFKKISSIPFLHFLPEPELSTVFARASTSDFLQKKFSNLIDSEPFYAKDFYNG